MHAINLYLSNFSGQPIMDDSSLLRGHTRGHIATNLSRDLIIPVSRHARICIPYMDCIDLRLRDREETSWQYIPVKHTPNIWETQRTLVS